MKIAVIGTGYVGLVCGACFASWGHTVVCFDNDKEKIRSLEQGVVPIYEPGLDELVERNFAFGRLRFSTVLNEAVKDAAIVFIAVGTPSRAMHGDADLSSIYMVARELAPIVDENTVIVVKSTVPVGTGDVVEKIINSVRKPETFSVASNPEFLREGAAIADFLQPDRVVIGVEDERARSCLNSLYGPPLGGRNIPIVVTQRRTSELIKYAANAFLAMKVTFINELADLCEAVGSDVTQLALGIGLDKRIGHDFLNAGPGYGGSCFPKDTVALMRTAEEHGVALRLLEETVAVNDARKRKMALKVLEALGGVVEGCTIAVLGLTFKPDTDDMRDAPSIPLIETLQRFGAHIRAYDPAGNENAGHILSGVTFFEDPYACVDDVDAAVVVTEWDSICKLDLFRMKQAMRDAVLIDLRNVFSIPLAEQHGIRISAIGQSSRTRQEKISKKDLPPARIRQLHEASAGARNLKLVGGSANETFDL